MTIVRKHLAIVADRHGGDLERACVHCGACCRGRVVVGDRAVQIPGLSCKHLRVDALGKSHCAVYEHRHEVAPWCHDAEQAIDKALYPDDCPYVEGLGGYAGTRALDAASYALLDEAIVCALRREPCPEWADPDAWAAYVGAGLR